MFVVTDLTRRIRLGMHHLCRNFDETRSDLPWFDVRLSRQKAGSLEHFECFDTAHVPGRCLDALLHGEAVTGTRAPESAVEIFRRYHLQSFDADDGLNGYLDSRTNRRTILFHNLREGLLGLNALIAWRGDEEALQIGYRMVAVVANLTGADGSWREDGLDTLRASADLQIGPAPAVTGRMVGPLLRFARLTGSADARDLATKLGAHVSRVAFDEDGRLTNGAGTHIHSITSTISSLCELAVDTGEENQLDRAEQIYRNAPAPWRSRFGWVKELIGPVHLGGEVNSTGDLVQAALALAGAGRSHLYGEAEIMLRGHLLCAQIMGIVTIESEWSAGGNEPAEQEDIASRLLGGFGFPTPNDRAPVHYDESFVRITTLDITAGSVQAMCCSAEHAVEVSGRTAKVNLLLDRQDPTLSLSMIDRNAGLFELHTLSSEVQVRVPQGSSIGAARFTPFGQAASGVLEGAPGYLRIAGGGPISGYLSIPPRSLHEHELLLGTSFEVDYVGEQLVGIEPAGSISPIGAHW